MAGTGTTPSELVDERRAGARKRHRRFRWTQFFKKLATAGAGGTALVFATSSSPLFSAEIDYKAGTDRWAVKTTINADQSVEPTFIDMATFVSLPALPELEDEKQYQTKRIPNAIVGGLNEGDIVTTTGFIHYAHLDDNDSDFHIQMNDKPTNNPEDLKTCLIVEVPHPKSAAGDPVLKKLLVNARSFIREHCFKGRKNGGYVDPPIKVTVTGQLFYDLHHAKEIDHYGPGGNRGRKVSGQTMKATTIWEIHPVFGVNFASGS